jgi:hypothetical protein
MKIKYSIYLFVLFFISTKLNAQSLPQNRKTDWTIVGLKDTSTSNLVDIIFDDYGANNIGQQTNDSIFKYLVDSVGIENKRIVFSAGEYLFKNEIELTNNLVLKGQGADKTTLIFDLVENGHGIKIQGMYENDTSFFLYNGILETNFIVLDNTNNLVEGDWIQIFQNDSSFVTSDWALGTIGQIVQIQSIIQDTIYLNSNLRLEYALTKNPFILKLKPKQNIGIECLKIVRLDNTAPFQSSNIYFDKAVNCWVNGIESNFCTFSHIQARFSSNLHISNSFFQEAFEYGGNGRAYGVMLHLTTNECLVENNIFKHLRHAMILQAGANANVFSFNYSIEPERTEIPFDFAADMVLHGNYPYLNLFEQNIGQHISIDNSHGPNGPFNTFFRNRAELWGIYFTASNSPNQNLIGNEITNTTFPYANLNYTINGANQFQYANIDQGVVLPSANQILVDISYAYEQMPNFLNANQWAKLGTLDSFNIVSIPAKDRFLNEDLSKAYCVSYEDTIQNNINILNEKYSLVTIYPNPTADFLVINANTLRGEIRIFDLFGNLLLKKEWKESDSILYLKDFKSGLYILSFDFLNGEIINKKLIIH